MNAASGGSRRRLRLGDLVAFALVGLLLGAAVLLHHGIGPEPYDRDPRWMDPGAFLVGWLVDDVWAPIGEDVRVALALLVGPLLAIAIAVFFLTRSVALRTLALAAPIAAALVVFYGLRAALVWRFFHWRWSAVMGLFALLVAAALLAPLWAERWRRLPTPLQLASYLPLCFGLIWLERDVTGTNQALRFAVSPWPMLSVFALEVVASAIAAGVLGVAAGLALLDRAAQAPLWARIALALPALAVAAGFPMLSLAIGSSQGLLPFRAGERLFAATALGAGAVLAGAAWLPRRRGRARRLAAGALLLGVPLLSGQLLTRWDYHVTRDLRAERIIEGLEAHYAREAVYPDTLDALIASGDLVSVPRPRIGFGWPAREGFTYQSFGESFLLEFSAPRWIQCAYSPALHFEEDEEDALEASDEALAGGSWSCPARPPELW